MEVHEDTLDKVMKMACLCFKPEELKHRQEDLNKMVLWVKQLLEVDTSGLEPLFTLCSECNVLGDDIPEEGLSNERALCNAPDAIEPYFSVPGLRS